MYNSGRRRNSKEYAWETVDLLYIGGTAHAYQQKYEVREKEKSDTPRISDGYGLGIGLTMVPTDEHRLKEMRETLNDESVKMAAQIAESE